MLAKLRYEDSADARLCCCVDTPRGWGLLTQPPALYSESLGGRGSGKKRRLTQEGNLLLLSVDGELCLLLSTIKRNFFRVPGCCCWLLVLGCCWGFFLRISGKPLRVEIKRFDSPRSSLLCNRERACLYSCCCIFVRSIEIAKSFRMGGTLSCVFCCMRMDLNKVASEWEEKIILSGRCFGVSDGILLPNLATWKLTTGVGMERAARRDFTKLISAACRVCVVDSPGSWTP